VNSKQHHTPQLGVCYYPEHWPEENWKTDAKNMFDMGIRTVRIGEFAWSRLEPTPKHFEFDWLQRAIDTLHNAGLGVVLGTPTATPPKWVLGKFPDLLAVDENGIERGFGSRRHYCFSHLGYRDECDAIVTKLAKAFGAHPGVYSKAALNGFHRWCEERYQTIDVLNRAWGNVFWSMEYNNFKQIGFPVAAVTETSPAHRLAFWRYSSDQVVDFNRRQVDIIRAHSPGRDVIHNYMGNFVEFDHHAVAKDLDVASWDNYPLGFLTRDGYSQEEQSTYLRTGHPDGSAFHHDLYRGCNKGRWWLMEQQPGPVNWAPYNPAPLPGMVRFWGWEAIAHGAEVVTELGGELLALQTDENNQDLFEQEQATIALMFDYTGIAAQRIQQPDGKTFDPLRFAQSVYSACRSLAQNIDIIASDANLSNYDIVIVTSNTISDPGLCERLSASNATVVLMPRVGSKTVDNNIPANLAPGAFQSLIPLTVTRSESLPDFVQLPTRDGLVAMHWRETVQTDLPAISTFDDGQGFHYKHGKIHYLNACLSEDSLIDWMAQLISNLQLPFTRLPEGVRTRTTQGACWVFNFGPEILELTPDNWHRFGLNDNSDLLLGKNHLSAGELAMWRR